MAGEEVVMSYLSLSDMSNQATDVMYTISVAGTLVFAANDSVTEDAVVSSDDALFEAVTDVAPTVFFGTVNVYERYLIITPSPGTRIFVSMKTRVFSSTNTQSKFASVVLESVLGPIQRLFAYYA